VHGKLLDDLTYGAQNPRQQELTRMVVNDLISDLGGIVAKSRKRNLETKNLETKNRERNK
jgi:hypothetical protein